MNRKTILFFRLFIFNILFLTPIFFTRLGYDYLGPVLLLNILGIILYLLFLKEISNNILVFISIFFGIGLINYIVSIHKYFFLYEYLLLSTFFILLIIPSLSKRSKQKIYMILYTALIINLIVGFFQFTGIKLLNITFTHPGRITGIFFNPNRYSGYLLIMIPLPILYLIQYPWKKIKIFHIAILLLCFIELYYTKSRGGIFSTVLMFLISGILFYKNYKRWLIIILMFIIFIILLTRFNINNRSFQQRLNIWKHTTEMILNKPVLGHGTNNFRILYPVYREYTDNKIIPKSDSPYYVHNDYLELILEFGLPTFGIIILILYLALKRLLILNSPAAKITCMSITGLLIHSTVDYNSHIYPIFMTVLTLLILNWSATTEKKYRFNILQFKKIAVIPFILILVYIIKFTVIDIYINSANLKMAAGQNREAINVLTQAENSYSEYDYIFGLKGNCYLKLNDNKTLKSALENYMAAHKLNPYKKSYYYNLSVTYYKLGKIKDAFKMLNKLRYIEKESPELDIRLATLSEQFGYKENAKTCLYKYLLKRPDDQRIKKHFNTLIPSFRP